MAYQDREHIRRAPGLFKTLVGLGSSTIATLLLHPCDLLKTRMQIKPTTNSVVRLVKLIIHTEGGYGALYKGLSAALTRNVANTSVRLGSFYALSERHKRVYDRWPVLYDNILIGVVSGLLGAVAGTPADLVLIRMAGDGNRIGPCNNARYSGISRGINRIMKNEGFFGLWRGGLLTVTRAVMISGVQIYSYKTTHEMLKERYMARLDKGLKFTPSQEQNMQMHLITGVVSSLFTSVLTLPIDLVKTKYQFLNSNQQTNYVMVLREIVRSQGFTFFWRGFLPYYTRMTIHILITFIVLDYLCAYYVEYYNIPTSEK